MEHLLARRGRRASAVLLAGFALLLSVFFWSGGSARAADSTIDSVASALKDKPVYVDPSAPVQLSSAQIDSVVSQIHGMHSGTAVFIAILPNNATFHQSTLLQQLRNKVGLPGVYAASVDRSFHALDFSGSLRTNQANNLAIAAAQGSGGNLDTVLTMFVSSVDSAVTADGRGTSGGKSSSSSKSGAGALILIVVLVVIAGGTYFAVASRKKRRAKQRRAIELDGLKRAVDEDITAYGEVLDRLDFSPGDPTATDEMRADYSKALDQYEAAKNAAAAAQRPEDMKNVTEALDEGRFALATLDARRKGAPLPQRRPPCFFDPRHGPSVGEVTWAPPGGAPRPVPACAADMTRVDTGQQPQVRQVETAYGPQPYYNAGPAYAPWAGGYFGGGVLPALMIGTVMGSMFSGPDAYIENNYYDNGGGGWGDGGSGGGGGDNGGSWGDSGGSSDWGGSDWGGGGDSGGGSDWGGGGDW
ncbi:hypothetical protein [Catenulispora rubra]|uniref:hypothetical protein n=1 Tax=Catenulispora rubra TaxID=280293 RepID=UPI001892544E|nr:hypothetical protein [Catenulispora rubra]